jgi:hypothetical protein
METETLRETLREVQEAAKDFKQLCREASPIPHATARLIDRATWWGDQAIWWGWILVAAFVLRLLRK